MSSYQSSATPSANGFRAPGNFRTWFCTYLFRPGTVFVTSVSGAKQYELAPKHSELFAVTAADVQLYQIISIEKNRLGYRAYVPDGTLMDEFILERAP